MTDFIDNRPINAGRDAQELNPLQLPLGARHLIEASAGTGKTFNITRLYVRLLVEKSYSVQQILVMTFTEAATEEIRTRVAEFIDEVLLNWDGQDAFILGLQERVDKEHARRLLESAKLTIDDASIFTIHGFCQRVITQFSASMKQDPDSTILTQTESLIMQALADAIIGLDKQGKDFAALQNNSWHTPSKFYNAFRDLLYYQDTITLLSAETIWQEYLQSANGHWQANEFLRYRLVKNLKESDNWLDGLASNPKNAKRVEDEKSTAIAFLQKSELLGDVEGSALYDELKAGEFNDNPYTQIIDDGLLKLFSTARLKKYPQDWLKAINQDFEQVFAAIREPLKVSGDNRLDKRMQLTLAHAVVLKVVNRVQAQVYAQMQQDSLHSYDDLIRIVAQTISGPNAEVISSHLLKQFPAALVDEFQDTDQQQYSIFSRLYKKAEPSTTLIMIGDPKQAIYGFRGGDVFTYLQARQDADYLWSMDTNWRSTQDMVAAYNFVFSSKPERDTSPTQAIKSVFDYGIEYLPIIPAQGNKKETSQLTVRNQEDNQALQFVCADAFNENERFTDIDVQRLQIIHWMINEIKILLRNGTIEEKSGSRIVQAKDIAILVRAGYEADLIKQLFNEHGIASVYLSEKSPLFDSRQAHYLYFVLDAIWTGNDQRRCITALATGIFYHAGDEVIGEVPLSTLIADHSHPQWQSVYKKNAQYRQIWQKQGIYALVMHLIKDQLSLSDASDNPERALTNYQHLAELLAKAAVMHTTQSAQLMWLAKQINQIDKDETAQLRLESDQALIKIVTQHKSKGLEYPIVFLPFANIGRKGATGRIVKYHDKDNALIMQLGSSEAAADAMRQEILAEDMRLLYVALTRPIYRCYIGMLSSDTADQSAIHRALQLPALQIPEQDGNHSSEVLSNYADTLISNILHVTQAQPAIGARKASALGESLELPEPDELPKLHVRKVTRSILQQWVLTSFTGITRLMHADSAEADLASRLAREPEFTANNFTTNNDTNENTEAQEDAQAPALELRFSMTKGANTGNILHDTCEWLSFMVPDFEKVLKTVALRHTDFSHVNTQQYRQWINECLKAPINSVDVSQKALSLSSLPDSVTIKETEFYLPIEKLDSSALERLLRAHRQRVAEQFGFSPVPVNRLSKTNIEGMLHGFIDLIFMADEQYYVCDYKSTHLGNRYADYTSANTAYNIQLHDYDLQYLLYAMALDRFLAQSLIDYQHQQHFGGVYYLYLRGMTDAPAHLIDGVSPGVFFTPILEQELAQLNALFANESPSAKHAAVQTQNTHLGDSQ
ncbi:exodeoxyribonuclease V subunit beta [Glaciecola sp. SC05]|uniref:exodeoxyribonuclease V subunit beta n=1 Tax=Glaciecola sp. SC05 TaxID=1987355 RepID=UPI003528FF09